LAIAFALLVITEKTETTVSGIYEVTPLDGEPLRGSFSNIPFCVPENLMCG
jgi:hypothetical protein